MARRLQDNPNTVAPGGSYPYGRAKDNTGSGNGTPVNEQFIGDITQFFERLMALTSTTANGFPENSTNGFQFITALAAYINSLSVSKSGDTMTGNLNMGGTHKVVGLPDGTNSGEAIRYEQLQSEITNRAAADTTLQNNITSEASTRASADTTLQGEIDAINANKYDDERDGPSDGSTVTVLTIPTTSGKNIRITARLVSRYISGTGSSSDASSMVKTALFKNVSGTLTQLGSTQTVDSINTAASGPVLAFGISGSNIIVTAQAGSGTAYHIKSHAEKNEV